MKAGSRLYLAAPARSQVPSQRVGSSGTPPAKLMGLVQSSSAIFCWNSGELSLAWISVACVAAVALGEADGDAAGAADAEPVTAGAGVLTAEALPDAAGEAEAVGDTEPDGVAEADAEPAPAEALGDAVGLVVGLAAVGPGP